MCWSIPPGMVQKGDLLTISDDDWHKGMEYYLMNVIRLPRWCPPHMEATGAGGTINQPSRLFAAFWRPDARCFRLGSGCSAPGWRASQTLILTR